MDDVTFTADAIVFHSYPFRPASVHPHGRVTLDAIEAIDPTEAPPEVRLTSGEILFVSAEQRVALEAFITRHGLPVVQRLDVWHLLLEPYLDTEFDDEQQALTMQRLAECGLDTTEVEAIRLRVGKRMLAYNSLHGDWCHLGLCDLLDAMMPRIKGLFSRRAREEYERLYWFGMEVAARGFVLTDRPARSARS